MKRFHAAALAAILAGGVPASAQQPAAPAQPAVMTLTGHDGKPARQCKVLRTYKHADGGTAFEVKDETSGEVMTVIEKDTPFEAKPVSATESAKPVDPILEAKDYAPAHVRDYFGTNQKPSAPYTKPPVPATRRWLNVQRSESSSKPQAVQMKKQAAPTQPEDMVALYHPDPVMRLIGCMTDDVLPSMREVSAENLAREGKGRPEVIEALVRSARTDPAPSVRACCCRCLAEMQDRSAESLAVLHQLQNDKSQSVRTAAAAAMDALERP